MPMSFVALAAQHREHAAGRDARGERARELGDLDLLVAEVALHHVVVADHDALDERVVDRVLLAFHLGGDRAVRSGRRPAGVGDRVVVEQLDDRRERGFLADREVQRRDARAEAFLELVERARERRALAVELVDEDRPRDAALLGELPRDLGLHLDAFDRGHDEQREVGGLERGADVADEVGVARRVEQVHLRAVELERRERERHRDPAPLLLGVEVADRRAVLDLAQAGDRPGGEQEGLGQRRLAGATVAHEGDVADVGRRERLHPVPPGSRRAVWRLYERRRCYHQWAGSPEAAIGARSAERGGTLEVLADASA